MCLSTDDHEDDITCALRRLIEKYDEEKWAGPFLTSHGSYYIAYRCENRRREKISKIKVARASEDEELYECTIAAEIKVKDLKNKEVTVLRRAEQQTDLSMKVLHRLPRFGMFGKVGYLHKHNNPRRRDFYWENIYVHKTKHYDPAPLGERKLEWLRVNTVIQLLLDERFTPNSALAMIYFLVEHKLVNGAQLQWIRERLHYELLYNGEGYERASDEPLPSDSSSLRLSPCGDS